MFEQIIGNEQIKGYLKSIIAKKAIANSFLFAGPSGIGKGLFAEALTSELLGSAAHPDMHIYRPEGKLGLHSIEAMRNFSEKVYMAPFQGPWKVFIIHDAERMLPYSANALLKTFEEPAIDTIIILISSMPASLLPTILSRCRALYFQCLSDEQVALLLESRWKVEAAEARRIAGMAKGSMGKAVHLIERGGDETRRSLLNFLSKGKQNSYKDIREFTEKLGEKIEISKKQIEEASKADLFSGQWENLSAVQKNDLEKEIEGVVALQQMQLSQSLFADILGWFRDLQLLSVNGNLAFLIHRDYEEVLQQALQRGEVQPLAKIQQAISDAQLAVDRATALSLSLETLFLKLF